jgi:RNA polymerase-binding transcription factor DksA
MHYFTIEQRETLQALLQSRAGALRAAPGAAELREVESALERLHSADFGLCADCGAEIAYAYLQTHLFARHCAACEAKHR